MLSTIYFERQEPGSQLCAQHALNNLLQSAIYTPQDLAHNAQVLDELESAQMHGRRNHISINYDDSGFFSIGVMEEALKPLELRLVRWGSEEMESSRPNPENMEAFILNQNLHWYTVRRFASKDHFYTLDSCREEPEHVSPMYLGLMLRDAEIKGYSIFAVLPTADSKVGGLPPCEATTEAARIPPPGSFRSASSYYNPTNAFSGHGNVLGSNTASSSGMKRYSEDDGSGGEVSDESNARSRRPRLEDQQDFMTEDEQMALAIADSLQLSSISTTASPAKTPPLAKMLDDSDSDVEILSSATTTRAPLQLPRSRPIPPTAVPTLQEPQARRSRADQEEEDELAAAIKASMMGAPVASTSEQSGESKGKEKAEVEEEEEEEFDEPSAEELRRRRLARFG